MTDLPQQPVPDVSASQPAVQAPIPTPVGYSGGSKEAEGAFISPEVPLRAVGQEAVLPKEVVSAGVKVQPQSVPLPQQVANMGVQSVGANVPPQPTDGNTITLPLSDAQIAQALHESVTSSIRWLAEWCTRRIKIMHQAVKRK